MKDLKDVKEFSNNLIAKLNNHFTDFVKQYNYLGFVLSFKISEIKRKNFIEILLVLNIYGNNISLTEAENNDMLLDPFIIVIKNNKLILSENQIFDLISDKCSYYLEKLKINSISELAKQSTLKTKKMFTFKRFFFNYLNRFNNLIIIITIIVAFIILISFLI